MKRGREILKEREEQQKERERQLQQKFNADAKDVLAFSVAAWQLILPVVVALLITGFIMIWLLNLF
jgi:hypothetical protein